LINWVITSYPTRLAPLLLLYVLVGESSFSIPLASIQILYAIYPWIAITKVSLLYLNT
jgi:hypothetical protein